MTDVLYSWEVFEAGEWNIIAALLPNAPSPMPLVTTRSHVADMLGLVAVQHHDRTRLPVRKAVYLLDHVAREIP